MIDRNSPSYLAAKDRVKISHFTEKGYDIRGIIHVGANDGYELKFYQQMGVEHIMAFEPIEEALEKLLSTWPSNSTRLSYSKIALGSSSELKRLNLTKGDGKSSSFLNRTSTRLEAWPDEIPTGERRLVEVVRFDEFIESPKSGAINIADYNCLVVDVEGMELEVLKGFGKYLKEMDLLSIECSEQPIYEGGVSARDVIDFLTDFQQDSPITEHDDIMFIRKDLLK